MKRYNSKERQEPSCPSESDIRFKGWSCDFTGVRNPRAKMLNWITKFLIVQLSILSGCSTEEQMHEIKGDSHIRVETVQVRPQTMAGSLDCFGVLEAVSEVTVNVDFSAPVAEVLVNEGQRVAKGDLLLRFDTEKLELKYQQTRAALSQEESELENLTLKKQRIERLLQSATVSQQTADNARSAYRTALGRVKELQNSLKLLQRDLENSVVRSPVDAIVNARKVEMGQNTVPYESLFHLEATNSLNVSVYVGETAVSLLRVGVPVVVTTVAGSVASTITSIGAKSDPQTGNFEVKVAVDNSGNILKPGMTAEVELALRPLQNMLVIPQEALSPRHGRYVVFQVMDGKAKRREVQVTMDYGDQILVTRGLSGGENIITAGADLVRDGAKVKVML